MAVAQRLENAVRTLRVHTVTDNQGIKGLPIPEGMKLQMGAAGTEPIHHDRSDPHDPIEGRIVSTDEGVGNLIYGSNTGEDMAIRCRTMARTMPLNSAEQRDMFLKASFYKQCGTEVRIDPNEGTMSGPPEAVRNAFIWYRDRAKMNLTPEQEEFLREEA